MGDVIRFPLERRQDEPKTVTAGSAGTMKLSGPGIVEVSDGVYVWEAGWFGVRIRPDDPTPSG